MSLYYSSLTGEVTVLLPVNRQCDLGDRKASPRSQLHSPVWNMRWNRATSSPISSCRPVNVFHCRSRDLSDRGSPGVCTSKAVTHLQARNLSTSSPRTDHAVWSPKPALPRQQFRLYTHQTSLSLRHKIPLFHTHIPAFGTGMSPI